jgi:hypothetical protein
MTIIAIDPGKRGGIATHYAPEPGALPQPDILSQHRMPETIADLETIVRAESRNDSAVAYVEHVQGFAGDGRPGFHMFSLGENFGAIQGILAAHRVRTVLVRPQKWQKFFALGTRSACKSDNEWKNKLKAEAQRRFPQLNVTLATADALLLLDYAMRQERPPKP